MEQRLTEGWQWGPASGRRWWLSQTHSDPGPDYQEEEPLQRLRTEAAFSITLDLEFLPRNRGEDIPLDDVFISV